MKKRNLFFNGFLDDGTQLDEETLSKFFILNTVETDCSLIDSSAKERVEKDINQYAKKIMMESEEKNNNLLK